MATCDLLDTSTILKSQRIPTNTTGLQRSCPLVLVIIIVCTCYQESHFILTSLPFLLTQITNIIPLMYSWDSWFKIFFCLESEGRKPLQYLSLLEAYCVSQWLSFQPKLELQVQNVRFLTFIYFDWRKLLMLWYCNNQKKREDPKSSFCNSLIVLLTRALLKSGCFCTIPTIEFFPDPPLDLKLHFQFPFSLSDILLRKVSFFP